MAATHKHSFPGSSLFLIETTWQILGFLSRIEIKKERILFFKHQWNTKWAFPRKLHIFIREDNMLSSHVKKSSSSWLHNKSHLWKQTDLVFHWCLYNKQNITDSLNMDMNFIFSCSTRYLSCPLEDKIHIHARACNILYIIDPDKVWGNPTQKWKWRYSLISRA